MQHWIIAKFLFVIFSELSFFVFFFFVGGIVPGFEASVYLFWLWLWLYEFSASRLARSGKYSIVEVVVVVVAGVCCCALRRCKWLRGVSHARHQQQHQQRQQLRAAAAAATLASPACCIALRNNKN